MSCDCDPTDDKEDWLTSLPPQLLYEHILPHLEASDLIHLACCCTALRSTTFRDDLWTPLCEAYGWGPFPRGMSWQAGFSARRMMLCVECGKASRYVFALLHCRLCEACEHKSPRYGLVTALEAAERYGVPYTALSGLPYHEACSGTRFYLRSAVEGLAVAGRGGGGGGGGRRGGTDGERDKGSDESSTDEGTEDEEEHEEEEGGGEVEQQQQGNAAEPAGSDRSNSEDEQQAGGSAGRRGTQADKAARKAAKKAAKEAQRLKRQQHNTAAGGGTGWVAVGAGGGGGGGRGSTQYGSPPTQRTASGRRNAQQQSPHHTLSPQLGARTAGAGGRTPTGAQHGRRGGRGFVGGSSPPGCRAAGPLLAPQEDDGTGVALPLEGQAVPLPRSRSRGAGRGGGGEAGGSGSRAGPKLKSGWAAEREALMAAWGQFGISGLVLAS